MGRRDSKSRALALGGAISTCLILAVTALGRGSAAGSAPSALVGTDPPPTPATTVTVLTTVPVYTPSVILETSTSVVVVTKTVTSTVPSVARTTQTSTISPSARPPVTLVVPSLGTVTRTARPNSAVPSKGNVPVVTVTGPGTTTVSTQSVPLPQAAAKVGDKPLSQLRLAAGSAGVAVTSAAGFGFLILRRRSRHAG